ncbi:hypothetical protein KGF56_003913 [Candida oxycetoniae]|uniref:Uncharacterized protein n=1 Tax=Candida oxycetoniae TaxID=497107 RepID=A0AAI9WX30_9ASCO|nr:uncharacterized protein KGF56_003913 [Candida oxycetoniae]KAI3403325.2 hypothetical protein KGF56_003913 [Candida oxycetoniae]
MPVAVIDCTSVSRLPSSSVPVSRLPSSSISPSRLDLPPVVTTSYGLTLLEIQGELNLPSQKPACASCKELSESEKEKLSQFITIDDIYDAVKFGNLQFDSKDESKVTLFIGKSQRLVGSIVKLNIPLGLMKIPVMDPNRIITDDDGDDEKDKIEMIDIIRAKMIFKQRPLPIM